MGTQADPDLLQENERLRGQIVALEEDGRKSQLRRVVHNAVTLALLESNSVQEVVSRVLQAVCDHLNWDFGDFMVIDHQEDALQCFQMWQSPHVKLTEFADITRGITFARGIGLPGRVWMSGQPGWIPDVTCDDNFPRRPAATKDGIHGGFSFPVIIDGEVSGILEFFSREVRQPDTDLLEMFANLGNHIGQYIKRKQADAALAKASETLMQLAAVVESSDDAIVSEDLRGIIRSWNKSAERIFGYSAEEVIGRSMSILFPPDRLHQETQVLQQLRQGQRVDHFETARVRKDGQRINILATISPVLDTSGQIVGASNIARDLTEQRINARALLRSEEHVNALQDFFDNANVGLHWVGPDGTILQVNHAELKMLGYMREEYLGHDIKEFHVDLPVIQDILDRLLQGESLADYEARMRCKDGSVRVVQIYSSAYLENGRFIHTRCFTRDITERKRADQVLHEIEERLNLALRSSRMGVWSWSVVDDSITWDDFIYPLFGLKSGAGPKRYEDFLKLLDPDDRERVGQEVARSVEDRAVYDTDFHVVWPDGSRHTLASRGKLYQDSEGRAVRMAGICWDITESKLAQEKLKAEEQLLRRLLELQEEERRLVAHDIHDGLVQDIVGAYFHLHAVRGGLDSDTIESKVELVGSLLQKAIGEGRRLIRDLRPMGLDEGGLAEAIEHLIADEQKRVGLVVTFQYAVQSEHLESRLAGAIFRIVQEALTNVKRHAQTNHATVQIAERDGTLHVMVRDLGVGFDPSTVSPERFGLYGIRERALLFGGDARIESAPGEGTAILVQLPLQVET